MTAEHEYALMGGYNRSHIGRWLNIIASGISAAIVFLLLFIIDISRYLGVNVNVPPVVLSLVGAGTVYFALYWLFDRYIWKIDRLGRILKIPNIAGTWRCQGLRLDMDQPEHWSGTVTIVQSWDKIRLYLNTDNSESDSLAAALQYDSALGYRLMYHYQNRPRIGESELSAHHGFAELIFPFDLETARGEYFNGRGRYSFGTMTLVKEKC